MKMMKLFGSFFLALIILVVGLCWIVSANVDDMIKDNIQQKMTALTNTEVTLAGLEIDLFGGRVVIKDLVIANPKGYRGDHLVRLGEVQVRIDVRSLNNDAIFIEGIQLNEVDVVIEEKSIGQVNIKTLIETVESADPEPELIDLLHFRLKEYSVGESTLHIIGGPVEGKTLSLPAVARKSDLGNSVALPLKDIVKGLIKEIMTGILKEGQRLMRESIGQGFAQKMGRLSPPSKSIKTKIRKIESVIKKDLPPLGLPPLDLPPFPFLP